MGDDTRELLTLLAQAGRVAERLLAKSALPVPEPDAAPEPEFVVKVGAQPAPEPVLVELPPERPSVVVPANFTIGRRSFEDRAPEQRHWYTRHAIEQLQIRYRVPESMAYKTMQHVYRSIQLGSAQFLYEKDTARIYAVNIFGRVGGAVTDAEVQSIITFLPEDAFVKNSQIVNQPDVRARLERFTQRTLQEARLRVKGAAE